jgi:aminomethyltransferase
VLPTLDLPLTMTTALAQTPLHDWHVGHGGRMVDFAGWSMPVQYTSIADEHQATRTAIGVFDISHMGRLEFFGPEAAKFFDALVTRRVLDMMPGQVRYSLLCDQEGGILDDVLVYRLAANPHIDEETPEFRVVVNASNRTKIIDWFGDWLPDYAVRMADVTGQTAMIAVQGPQALALVDSLVDCDLRAMRYFTSSEAHFGGIAITISRTGYTGEDGCEIICPADKAADTWDTILSEGEAVGARAVGLGARDTLRLEAAMPLYGHELTEFINPIQAGLSFAVNLGDREFVGREALERLAKDTNQPVRVGLQLNGKRVPRQGCPVQHGSEIVGDVTSGTFSPTFQRPIAMAYVRPTAQAVGTHLAINIRGTPHAAVVVPLPFYRRGKEQ